MGDSKKISSRRPKSSNLPGDVARKLKDGRAEIARARKEQAKLSTEFGNLHNGLVVPVIRTPDSTPPARRRVNAKSKGQSPLVSRSLSPNHGSSFCAGRASSQFSIPDSHHTTNGSNSKLVKDTLQVPTIKTPHQDHHSGSKGSLDSLDNLSVLSSSPESEVVHYLDECMRTASNEALAVSRDPLPRGSSAYEVVMHGLSNKNSVRNKESAKSPHNNLSVLSVPTVKGSLSAPSSPSSARRRQGAHRF